MKKQLTFYQRKDLAEKFLFWSVVFTIPGMILVFVSVDMKWNMILLVPATICTIIGIVFIFLSLWIFHEKEPKWKRKADQKWQQYLESKMKK